MSLCQHTLNFLDLQTTFCCMTKNGTWITMRTIWLGKEFQTGGEERRRMRMEIERKRAGESRKWKDKFNLASSIRKKKPNTLNSSGDLTWEPHRALFLWLFPLAFISFHYYFYNVLGIRFGDKLESHKFWVIYLLSRVLQRGVQCVWV